MRIPNQYVFPDFDRLSVVAATIMLAYAMTRYLAIEPIGLSYQFIGIQFAFQINFKTIVSILVAGLAAAGSDWLLRDHPVMKQAYKNWRSTLQHWILPGLTAWVIGVPLNNLSTSPDWWIIFGMGGVLLVLVFIAEYSVVDVSDIQHPLATIGLTAISFALFLILAIAVRSADFRLYLMFPALFVAIWLVSLRALYLRLNGRWFFLWATIIAAVIGQISMALHYWPLQPVRFGLLLLGPAYALTNIAGNMQSGKPWRKWVLEPAVMLLMIWAFAFWLA